MVLGWFCSASIFFLNPTYSISAREAIQSNPLLKPSTKPDLKE